MTIVKLQHVPAVLLPSSYPISFSTGQPGRDDIVVLFEFPLDVGHGRIPFFRGDKRLSRKDKRPKLARVRALLTSAILVYKHGLEHSRSRRP
jgi:hypothetical protein